MPLFDDIPRPDTNVPDQHEAAFAYLNRSGRPERSRVRQLAEDWLARYPAHDRDALIARLRSTIDDQHRGAFSELLVHELLFARGHRILEIEPKLPHTPKSPDFLVQAREGHRLYLECVLATGRSQQEVAAQARLNQTWCQAGPAYRPHLSVFVPPTNNVSERYFHPSVFFRKVTKGFRCEWGAETYAAFRSVVGTGKANRVLVFEVLRAVLLTSHPKLPLTTLG